MVLNEFIDILAEEFEDTEREEFAPDTEFQNLDEWDSLAALNIIALARTRFGKNITGREIRGCTTVEDLYNLIEGK